MPQGRRNLIGGAVLLVIGIGYAFSTAALPDRSLPNTPGPAFFPWLIAVVLITLSLGLVVRGWLDTRNGPDGAPGYRMPAAGWVALGAFLVYLILLPILGFVAAGIPFFAGLMWLYGERNKLVIALGAGLIPLALFYVFTAGFQILLPRGPWL